MVLSQNSRHIAAVYHFEMKNKLRLDFLTAFLCFVVTDLAELCDNFITGTPFRMVKIKYQQSSSRIYISHHNT